MPTRGFPWWSAGKKNPSANVRDMGSIPENIPYTAKQLNPYAKRPEPAHENPGGATADPARPGACAAPREKPPQ